MRLKKREIQEMRRYTLERTQEPIYIHRDGYTYEMIPYNMSLSDLTGCLNPTDSQINKLIKKSKKWENIF